MRELVVCNVRGETVESRHRVSLAICDTEGELVAQAGDPNLVTFMRSAAKPFQAVPLVEDGAVAHFGITARELALACSSHNSERQQVDMVRAWLGRIGCREEDLACGPHSALGRDYGIVAETEAECEVAPPSRLASNCSGKHAGMLTLAKHHGWPTEGYHRAGHPVQTRVKHELARWTNLDDTDIPEGTDGCGVVTFALPLRAMAAAMANLVTSSDAGPRAVVDAMFAHPDLVAGCGRLCTALMRAYPRGLVAKVGAEGVYVAGLLDRGLGVTLKVEDGHGKAAIVALLASLDQLGLDPPPADRFPEASRLPIRNTRGEVVGIMRAEGELTFV